MICPRVSPAVLAAVSAAAALAVGPPARAIPLARAVDDALQTPTLSGASYGLVVWGTDGRAAISIDPDRRLLPASTAKWLTAAAAADSLGLDHRFETVIAATGYTEGDVLHGDLVVKGGGDPSTGDPDPARFVADLVQVVRQVGITAVDGDVVVDTSLLPAGHGPGWMYDDFAFPYSPPYAAMNVAHNLSINGIGCPAYGAPGSPVMDPPACVASLLRASLEVEGVPVSGVAAVRAEPEAAPIGSLASPPLRDLLRKTLVESDNLYAECIARALPDGAIDAVLLAAGVLPGRVHLVDGSGLSRYSFASAQAFVQLSAWIEAQPWGAELIGLLPVAGRQGTLSGRMLGTAAEGRVHAKTGSMTGVRNLVGYIDVADGARVRFAFLINGLAGPPGEAIAIQDRVVALIAASDGRKLPKRVAATLGAPGG